MSGRDAANEEADALHSFLNFENGASIDGPAFYEVSA
jgi:hypothetical protein